MQGEGSKKNRTRVKAVSAQYLVVAAQGIYLSDSERLGPDEPRWKKTDTIREMCVHVRVCVYSREERETCECLSARSRDPVKVNAGLISTAYCGFASSWAVQPNYNFKAYRNLQVCFRFYSVKESSSNIAYT